MSSAEKYLWTGRINYASVGSLIQGGDTVGSSLWEGDVVDNPPHGMGPGLLLEWVGATYCRTSNTAASWKMEKPLLKVGNP